jgi:hypothetical protein
MFYTYVPHESIKAVGTRGNVTGTDTGRGLRGWAALPGAPLGSLAVARLQGTCGRRLWRRAPHSIRTLLWRPPPASQPFTGNSEIVEGGLWKRSITLYGCCVKGNWRLGLLYWGPWRLCTGRFWWRASFHRGPAGDPGRGLVYRGRWKVNERGLWKWGISLWGSSVRGTWRECFFAGDPKRYAE